MSWGYYKTLDLDLADRSSAPLLAVNGDTVSDRTDKPVWTAADKFELRLIFRDRSEDDAPITTLPAGAAVVVAGKQDTTAAEPPLLFSASGFSEVVDGDATYYKANLDLNTEPVETLMGTDKTATINVDVEIQNADNSLRVTLRFQVTLQRQVYAGEGDPTEADPLYPAAGSLILDRTVVTGLVVGQDYIECDYSGFGLTQHPEHIFPSLLKPSAAAGNIVPVLRGDSVDEDSCIFDLTAAPTEIGYELSILVVP